MAAPASVDEFLELVRKSGVTDEKTLDAYLKKARAALPAVPAKAAGFLIRDGLLTNFQAENILAGKWRRFSIGKYKVLEKLGSGGFAQVYLCEHKMMRRRVAVKVLPVAKTKGSSALARFFREARAAATLDHPNLVHAFDLDQDGDLHFIAMEFVDGPNLQQIVKASGPLGVARASYYICQAGKGLQYAHEAGLIHRDIKPGNILVDRGGVVKILDLGLALVDDEDQQITQVHADGALGSADYLSPEQATDSHAVDQRTDIYALGCTFYFLLTGRAPFEHLPLTEKLSAHLSVEPRPIAEYRKDVPGELLALIEKMMAKKVDRRHVNVGAVIAALEPFAQNVTGLPADSEMPNLSPAASTIMGPDSGTPVPAASAPTRAASAAPVPTSATVTFEEFSESTPAPQDFALEEGDAPAHIAGEPGASRRRRTAASTSRPTLFLVVLVLGFVVIPIVLVIVIAGVIWFFATERKPVGPIVPGPITLAVSKDRPGAQRTIQAALRAAKPDATIELWDDSYEENVVIDTNLSTTNVRLQAAPGKLVTWRARNNDPSQPILRFRGASDFKLLGKGITLDGTLAKDRRIRELIMIHAECPGLTIEDLELKGFDRSAILIMNAVGAANRPITLTRLITQGAASPNARGAIYFDANLKVTPQVNDYVVIEDGDFRAAAGKAVQFADKSVLGNDIRWPGR